MIKIEFELFSTLEWRSINRIIVGDSEEDCYKEINKEYPLKFRYKTYQEKKEDSLKIISIEEMKTSFMKDE